MFDAIHEHIGQSSPIVFLVRNFVLGVYPGFVDPRQTYLLTATQAEGSGLTLPC
jgi:hypothetical protein